jgi:hypothetical protein
MLILYAILLLQKKFYFMNEKKFNYRQQYGVIAICADEEEQKKIYEMLRDLGLTVKVVVV